MVSVGIATGNCNNNMLFSYLLVFLSLDMNKLTDKSLKKIIILA